MTANEIEFAQKFMGLDIEQVRKLRYLLDLHSIKLEDLNEFLEKQEVVLFARQQSEIRSLRNKIQSIKQAAEEL